MKREHTTLSLRCKLQRALNGDLYSEDMGGQEDKQLIAIEKIYPSIFRAVKQDKRLYEVKITLRELE